MIKDNEETLCPRWVSIQLLHCAHCDSINGGEENVQVCVIFKQAIKLMDPMANREIMLMKSKEWSLRSYIRGIKEIKCYQCWEDGGGSTMTMKTSTMKFTQMLWIFHL